MKINPELLVDGYKIDHRRQYPAGTQIVFSNLTARKTRRQNCEKIVFFGLQYFIKEYLINQWNENFFSQPVEKVLGRFNRRINNYLGPNRVGDAHIRELHRLGYLPICIRALPEGSVHDYKIPSFVIYNTEEKFFWLTNYLETILSTTIWGPCTSATTALQYRKLLEDYAMQTVGNTDFVQWQGHDFSFRGMFGLEAAMMSGGAHLTSFTGTDTIPAIDWLEEYYNADSDKELVGGSVPATEHSVACSVILDFIEKVRVENAGTTNETRTYDELLNLADIEYVRYLITDVYPEGIVSIVSDSFDYWNTITNTAAALKDVILSRNGKVVFRPDTGDPVKVVIGDDNAPMNTPEQKGSIECLWEIFGGTRTEKGFDLLDSHVGLIYGDSITLERAKLICQGLMDKGFASTNIVYGIGSFTYQYATRDTDGFAVKATFARVNGQDREIFKAPKTDDGTKKSAKGLTAVFKKGNNFFLKDQTTWEEVKNCAFENVFENGKLLIDRSFAEIRAEIRKYD